MHEAVGRTCMAMAGAVRGEEPEAAPVDGLWEGEGLGGAAATERCFHILGFDLMFSEDKLGV